MTYLLKGKEVYTSDGILSDSNILISDGKIKGINLKDYKGSKVIDLSKYKIIPGLIDFHVHGANGYDVMDGNYKSLNEISKYKAKLGVTSFMATTLTAPLNKIESAIENVFEGLEKGLDGAKVLGSYIEGPYLSKEYKGAHPEEYLMDIGFKEIERLISISKDTIKVIAIAPEKKNSKEVIDYLNKKGIIVSLGHTNATYNEALEAIRSGAKVATHTYNAMRGLHHREPGMLGAVLNSNIMAEIICDGIHVHPIAIEILLKCKKKEDIILITDCMMGGGLSDGDYVLGELKVKVNKGIARIYDGSLAGSTLKLINGVKNMVTKVGISLEKSLQMATINPARVLGLDNEIGSIEEGKCADIVALDDDFNVVFTMVDGKIVYMN
ncbi:MAG: N-acetylglucosamine-6-phosphate deacetylase [Firmicutes bacterium]|nr:N-acetylglucosamine-6-phosphate deacetylase [Bacillota bacterium]